MNRTTISALAVLAIASGSGNALAGNFSLGAGVENVRWKESTTPAVTETGLQKTIWLNWTQSKPFGWLAAYQFKFYSGNVDYNGANLITGAPVSSSTNRWGYTHEIQALYRAQNVPLEFVSGLGWDAWQRKLSPQQEEDWDVSYVRIGANVNTQTKSGLFGSAGVKSVIYTVENGNLQSVGFDQNPRLHPGINFTAYGQLGYRFGEHVDFVGYYDAYRFRQSNTEVLTANAVAPGQLFYVFQPQSKLDVIGVKLDYRF